MLAGVAADQSAMADTIARTVIEQGGRPEPGRFPSEFTAINDLAIRFLLERLIEHQQRDVAAMEECVAALAPMPVMRALAEEALRGAKEHLDIMNEVRANRYA